MNFKYWAQHRIMKVNYQIFRKVSGIQINLLLIKFIIIINIKCFQKNAHIFS